MECLNGEEIKLIQRFDRNGKKDYHSNCKTATNGWGK